MKLYRPIDLAKAMHKYIRRWKGASGDWEYAYPGEGNGRVPAKKEESTGGHRGTLKGVATEKQIKELTKHFARQPKGMGREKTIQTQQDLDILLTHTTFSLMSAGRNPKNEEDMKMTDAQIKARYKDLLATMKEEGYIYTQCRGKYENPEESIMVMSHDADRENMIAIGNKFHQDAIVFCTKGKTEMIKTTGDEKAKVGESTMEGTGYDVVPDATDYYTKMPLSTGENIKFCMALSNIAKALRHYLVVLMKAKKMPIGTVSKGRKKVAEGKWVDVSNGRTKMVVHSTISGTSREMSTAEKMRDAIPKGPKASADEKKRMSRAISSTVNQSYYSSIPVQDIDNALRKEGFLLVQEDGTEWSGMLLGNDSRTIMQVGRIGDFEMKNGLKMHTILSNAGVALSWYKDDKRRDSKYDIVAYLS